MPTIASLVEDAKSALLAEDPDQALAVCRHVLQFYPKHLEATGLLAEALRSRGEAAEARSLFLRVVSADPGSLFAHWALSMLAESAGDLAWAIWELQRAWECDPGHPEVRKELLRLTGTRPSLTAFGLARTHARGGLLQQASDEMRDILNAEPERLDVAVALAETLWQAGLREEAARVCEAVLADSPDCLRAGLVLGTWLSGGPAEGRARGAELLRNTLQLDPQGLVAAELLAEQAPPEVSPEPRLEIPELPVSPMASPTSPAGTERLGTPEATTGGAAAAEPVSSREAGVAAGSAGWLRAGEPGEAPRGPLGASMTARSAPSAEDETLDDLGPEWQALIAEEITLDPETEARLAQALAEAGGSGGHVSQGGWVEVSTAEASSRLRLTEVLGGTGSAMAPSGTSAPPAVGAAAPTRTVSGGERPAPPGSEPAGPAAERRPSLARAAELWRSGRPEAALEDYQALVGAEPGAADQVIDGLRGLAEAYPGLPAAHRALGDAYMRAGRFQQAVEEYKRG